MALEDWLATENDIQVLQTGFLSIYLAHRSSPTLPQFLHIEKAETGKVYFYIFLSLWRVSIVHEQ